MRRLPPERAPVVPGSTPVVAFGDPTGAEVATLSINPSAREFLWHGELLRGAQRRLATLESVGARNLDRLTEAQVATIRRRLLDLLPAAALPRLVDPLDELLRVGADVSYST
ncbi:MAG: hypothetical protein M3N32_02710 [Actinomycetota bacterium]|nr:hypothetical protein [Actinomycetota bacterium]